MLVCSHIIYNVYLAIVPEGEGVVRASMAPAAPPGKRRCLKVNRA